MVIVDIQGKKFNIPTGIEDVSIGRFIAFRNINPANNLQFMQWVLNSDHQFNDDDEVANRLAKCLDISQPAIEQMYEFMNDKAKHETPEFVEILGLTIDFKNDFINRLPYWPYEVCKALVRAENEKESPDETNIIPDILSHYFFSLVTKSPYDENKASDFKDVILDIPMVQAIQAANFFFRKLKNKSNGKLKSLIQRLNLNMKKRE